METAAPVAATTAGTVEADALSGKGPDFETCALAFAAGREGGSVLGATLAIPSGWAGGVLDATLCTPSAWAGSVLECWSLPT